MRILIAEDDAALSEALRFSLAQAGHAVDHVVNGVQADEALRTDGFALLILDLGLPRLDGLEVLRRLRKRNAALPVLILSGREQPEEKVTGLDLGADDYLVKPFSLSELHARVRALLRRGTTMAAPTLQHGELRFDTVARVASVSNAPLNLSLHEAGVLEILLRRFGHVVSKEQLVAQIYSYDEEVSHNAIEVYIHRLRKKLADSGVEVRTQYGRGYLLEHKEG